jgi:hypothetical protein
MKEDLFLLVKSLGVCIMKDEIEVIMWCLGGMVVLVVLAIIFKV